MFCQHSLQHNCLNQPSAWWEHSLFARKSRTFDFPCPPVQFLHHYCLNQPSARRERQELARIFAPLVMRPAGRSVTAASDVSQLLVIGSSACWTSRIQGLYIIACGSPSWITCPRHHQLSASHISSGRLMTPAIAGMRPRGGLRGAHDTCCLPSSCHPLFCPTAGSAVNRWR